MLVEEEIPLGAIALLGKGLGFIPTTPPDKENIRLDMKLVCNKISNRSNYNLCRQRSEEELTDVEKEKIDYQIPQKLRYNNYSYVLPSSDFGIVHK